MFDSAIYKLSAGLIAILAVFLVITVLFRPEPFGEEVCFLRSTVAVFDGEETERRDSRAAQRTYAALVDLYGEETLQALNQQQFYRVERLTPHDVLNRAFAAQNPEDDTPLFGHVSVLCEEVHKDRIRSDARDGTDVSFVLPRWHAFWTNRYRIYIDAPAEPEVWREYRIHTRGNPKYQSEIEQLIEAHMGIGTRSEHMERVYGDYAKELGLNLADL